MEKSGGYKNVWKEKRTVCGDKRHCLPPCKDMEGSACRMQFWDWNVFLCAAGLASYVANEGYGIATAVVGIILTATRILDGVTDPIIAIIIDKMNTRFGKIRILMVAGWLIESLAVLIMYCWASGKGHGIVLFVLLYCLYVIGYTMCNVTAQIVPAMLTNDPKRARW